MIGHSPASHLQPAAMEEDPGDETCVACHMTYDDYETVSVLRCTRYFRTICIDAWEATQLQRPGNVEPWCPCCRAPLGVEATFPDIVIFSMHRATEEAGGDDFHTALNRSVNSLFPVWAHAATCAGARCSWYSWPRESPLVTISSHFQSCGCGRSDQRMQDCRRGSR